MRELRQPHRIALQPLGEIMRGGLAFQRRVHRQHDLVDAARGDAADERIDREILGRMPSSAERRPPST
jgi:hypothetical protein